MDGLTPQRDQGLSAGDVRPVQAAPDLEAPERRVTPAQESSSDSPDLRQKRNDSVEISREALELIQGQADARSQIAGQAALQSADVAEALDKLNSNELSEYEPIAFPGKLDPALPALPFRSLQQGPDFTEPAQEGTGNLG